MAIQALVEQLNGTGLQDNFLSVGRFLSEGKWSEICEDAECPIETDVTRYATAVMLENTQRFIQSMDETTRAVAIGDFQKYALPMVRAIFPELIANEIVSVQPMLGPVSLVFYLDFVMGSNKGAVKRGDTAFSSVVRGPSHVNYSSHQIDEEFVAASAQPASSVSLQFYPAIPGTVVVTDGVQTAVDNGAGTFVGNVSAGTIDYAAGTISNLTFTATPSANVTASYQYDMEANANIPQMDMLLQSSPITARPRKLRTNWSLESAFNLRALHGLEAEVELTAAVAAQIRHEIDREIILDLKRIAGSGSAFWNKDLPSGVGYTEQKLTIIDAFVAASNLIHLQTGRGRATYIVCGENVASVIETLPNFEAVPGMPNGLTKGVYKCGRLNNQWDVYKDPFYPVNQFQMGFKGSSFLETGFAYCPYIPLYATPTIVLDDFIARKGLATQYGKKAINPYFYVTGEIGKGSDLETKAGVSAGTISSSGTAKMTHGTYADLGLTNPRTFGTSAS
jgi:hypothetical protein